MNERTRVLMIGGIFGALIGVLGAWLYLNSAEIQVDTEGNERIVAPSAGDSLKLGLGLLALLRQIAAGA